MTSDQHFLPILEQTAKILEIATPELDSLGTCNISFADDFQLSIVAPPFTGFVYLAAPVCMVNDAGSDQLYRRALETNYMLSATRGATLAIDSSVNQLLLCIRFPLDTLTPQVLADALVSMADVAEKLRKTLPFDNSAGAETNSIDLDSLRDSVILRG